MKKKRIVIGITASSMAAISVLGLGAAAFAGTDTSPHMKAPLTVQQVEKREAERQEKLNEALANAVEDGTITDEQRDNLLEFFETNKPEFDSEATREERQTSMDEFREKLDSFAKKNDIDLSEVLPNPGPSRPGDSPLGCNPEKLNEL